MTSPRLTWRQVLARRMSRHALTAAVPKDRLEEQVATICGAHAQVMSAAEISIGLRVAGITRADVRSSVWEGRSLVKTVGPRGTVHLLATRELPTWNLVLGEAVQQPGFPADVRMTAKQTDAVLAAIDEALADADLTVDELGAEVVRIAGAWAGDRVMPAFQEFWPRWRQALGTAAYRGVLVYGPNRGARTTYASARRWIGRVGAVDAEQAAREVLRCFLYAYGPATPDIFARWIGATPGWAREQFRRAVDDLERVGVEGDELWQLRGDDAPPAARRGRGAIRLLPYFDAYAVGGHPRERVFPGKAADRALARSQAGNTPVLVVDGLVIGVWHQKRSGAKLALTVEPFRELTRGERQGLDEQVARIAEIQDATASLTIGAITAGPHA